MPGQRILAIHRPTGLIERQAVGVVMIEALAVTIIGLVLRPVVTSGALSGLVFTSKALVGTPVVATPGDLGTRRRGSA